MLYAKKKHIPRLLLILLLAGVLWLTACGELEFGVETKVSSGRPEVTVVTTTVAEIPEGMALVTVTPSAQASASSVTPTVAVSLTASPTSAAAETVTATPTDTPTVTAVPPRPSRVPVVLPSPTPTVFWPEFITYPSVSAVVWPGESVTIDYEARADSATLCVAPVFTRDWLCRTAPTAGPYTLDIDAATETNLLLEVRAHTADALVVGSALILLYCDEDDWFFTGPPATCPDGAPVETAAAYQPFEHGIMLWLKEGLWWEEGEMIYVLFDDGNRRFESFPEFVLPDRDDPMPNIEYEPPEGLFVPESGFGLVWRENSWVRQRLGWALAPEAGYTTTVQREFAKDGANLYLLDFDGQLLVLDLITGDWSVRSQP